MILHEFPDLEWLKRQSNRHFSDRQGWNGRILKQEGWPNVVLNTSVKQVYRDNILGPVSMFSNLSGSSYVRTGSHSAKIEVGSFFMTNQDQRYTLIIDQKENQTETFNIHFGTSFADEVLASVSRSPEYLLDNNFEKPLVASCFYSRLYKTDDVFHRIVGRIRRSTGPGTLGEEEQLYELLLHLARQQHLIKTEEKRIPAIKASTREEILKRLCHATDYIQSFYDQDLSVEELAKVSCLSRFHFLRLFKKAFQKTPYQFIIEVRIQKAKELLVHPDLSIHHIANRLGFENPSSFSRLFFKQVGVYPTQFRSLLIFAHGMPQA